MNQPEKKKTVSEIKRTPCFLPTARPHSVLPLRQPYPFWHHFDYPLQQVVVSCGKRPVDITVRHKRLVILDFVNESKFLPHVDLFIHHGGSQSTYQGIFCAVPMIALAPSFDSHLYAEVITRNRIGCFFRPSRLNIDELVSATICLAADPNTKARAEALQKIVRSYNPREQALNQIKYLYNDVC